MGRRPHSSLDDRTPDQAYFDFLRSSRRLTPAEAPHSIDAEIPVSEQRVTISHPERLWARREQ